MNPTSLTTFTLTAPDGTSFSLRDDLYDGQFRQVSTACQLESRGTVWYTNDGTSATLVSDSVIYDNPFVSDTNVYPVSGHVYLRDGMQFRIDVGLVTWMEDRNGNRVNFKYTNSNLTEIRDTLGRVITITQADISNITTEVPVATITVRDANCDDRTTTIYADTLTHVLRDGGSTPTLRELWGGVLAGDGDTTPVNFPHFENDPRVVSTKTTRKDSGVEIVSKVGLHPRVRFFRLERRDDDLLLRHALEPRDEGRPLPDGVRGRGFGPGEAPRGVRPRGVLSRTRQPQQISRKHLSGSGAMFRPYRHRGQLVGRVAPQSRVSAMMSSVGAACCSMYCFKTVSGAPPTEMMQ